MKKTYKALGVLAAVLCCTLAFAVNRHGSLPKLLSFGNSTTESASQQDKQIQKLDGTLRVDPNALERARALVPGQSRMKAAEADTVANDSVKTEINEYFTSDFGYSYSDNVTAIDAENRTMSFTANKSALLTGIIDNYYAWVSIPDSKYVYSGRITSDQDITVYPCVWYLDSDNLFHVWENMNAIALTSENGYSSEFHMETSFPDDSHVIGIGFIVETQDANIQLTATDLRLYAIKTARIAQKWTSETDLEGLGITEDIADNSYIVKCDDGVTTLGVYQESGMLYVTGINTTATELTLPGHVALDNIFTALNNFGIPGKTMSWTGAESLTSLNLGGSTSVSADFSASALTDLHITKECSFTGATGFGGVYLHIPCSLAKANYKGYGFKRVLVGEETPDYPEGNVSNWVIPGEAEGEYFGIKMYDGNFHIAEIFTDKESVTLPAVTPYDGNMYYVRGCGVENNSNTSYLCKYAPNLRSVTVPDTYQKMNVNWTYSPITEMHMQGAVPSTYWSLPSSMAVFVRNEETLANYKNSSSWNKALLRLEGWEFEWMTVDVKRKGEFAQTYIEMTDADWSLGMYVKVTGTLNATDLGNIKNLTNLRKLDLSEAHFESLPNSFITNAPALTDVILPDYIKSIPPSAFYSCTKLQKVVAKGIERIGDSAFSSCYNLKGLNISNVKSIGSSAFHYCRSFNPSGFSNELATIGSRAFYNTAITEVVIPEKITILESSVFAYCSGLTKVALPSTMTYIGSSAFSGCGNLTGIILPEGLTSLDYSAFSDCAGLTEITIPSTLLSIGSDVFNNCKSLTTIKCKAVVPPVADGTFTSGMDLNHTTLYIAPFATDAYRAAQYWSDFYIMKPLNEPVKNIYVNRPMTFDLQSEDNAVLQGNPNMTLTYDNESYNTTVGQLSASGDGTLSAGIFNIFHRFERRDNRGYDYRTTLVNDAENMRADSVLCTITFAKNYWHFISFQYDVQMEDVFGLNGTDFVIRQYNSDKRAIGTDNTSNWEDVPADGTLLAGKGYIIQAANNAVNENGYSIDAIVCFPSRNTTTKNNLFTNHNVIVPLEEFTSEFAHNRSWNLVGNPYPCYYDMHSLMDDFTTPITLWRGSSYQAYSPVDDHIILLPNEAFFVQRPLDAEQMTFGAEGRMHYTAAYNANSNATPGISYAPAATAAGEGRSVFNFTVEGCGSNDRARIVMNQEASMNYEIERDASKFFAENAAGAELYVDGNVQYSICERPLDNGEALLGLRLAQKGEYTLSLTGPNTEGWSVMLTDNATGVTVDITETPYAFQSEAGSFEGRFTVTFRHPGISGVEDVMTEDAESDVQVVNAAGMVVFNGKLGDFKATAQPGVYVVVSKEKTDKIVVK